MPKNRETEEGKNIEEKKIDFEKVLELLSQKGTSKIKLLNVILKMVPKNGNVLHFSLKELQKEHFPETNYITFQKSLADLMQEGFLKKEKKNKFKYFINKDLII